jgi:hypothetical protein
MNALARQNERAKRNARDATEFSNRVDFIALQMFKAGIPLYQLREIHPGLRERDYVEIEFQYIGMANPRNRRARRARESISKANDRRLTRAFEQVAPRVEFIMSVLTPEGKKAVAKAVKGHPNPEGRYAPTTFDSADAAETRRALWEASITERLFAKQFRRPVAATKKVALDGH